MKKKIKRGVHFLVLICMYTINAQNSQQIQVDPVSFEQAYQLAYDGKNISASTMLGTLIHEQPNETNIIALWARSLSWNGDYQKARAQFNRIVSADKNNREAWIGAIKNELYAKEYYLALGLANKAVVFMNTDKEIERLRGLALDGVDDIKYNDDGWYNTEDNLYRSVIDKNILTENSNKMVNDSSKISIVRTDEALESIEDLKKSITVNSSFSVFNEVFDPMSFASISYKHETTLGSIIPRLNYSNRFGINGVQYDIDLYPKITKGMYAYVNYGYSSSDIYPKHRVGGDVYLNIKGGFEFSAGGRFISFANTDVSLITNSVGYYTGNYYFSLRSYITPSKENLTSISGNVLIRKYLKSAENYFGVNFGVGYSPELRQLTSQSQVLAETLLYLESQRLSLEYQFPSKNALNTYSTTLGVIREELSFAPGTFFWSFSAGITYAVEF